MSECCAVNENSTAKSHSFPLNQRLCTTDGRLDRVWRHNPLVFCSSRIGSHIWSGCSSTAPKTKPLNGSLTWFLVFQMHVKYMMLSKYCHRLLRSEMIGFNCFCKLRWKTLQLYNGTAAAPRHTQNLYTVPHDDCSSITSIILAQAIAQRLLPFSSGNAVFD